ncbi:phage protein Gp37 [Acinetobacter sp. YH01022]|uniref:phage protein Gp37 n=1 Tax=Acinetobacter sp. YH01022 TaxID=2601036 RepID=UPI0015D23E9F|nr:phage protein Gp37 [Acinetobacter sp. YH01022]
MVNLDLGTIEQAIKDVLAKQVQSRAWDWIREIKTYGGEFDDDISTIVNHFPAIWVAFVGSGTPKKSSHNKTEYQITFVVLVGAQSVRNEEARRHGAGSDIGTFTMLHQVQNLLIGNDLSSEGLKGLSPLELGKTKTIFNTKTRSQSISVLSQEFTTQYTITASDRDREEAATESEIHKVNFDYYFQPNDTHVDESDLVNLKE